MGKQKATAAEIAAAESAAAAKFAAVKAERERQEETVTARFGDAQEEIQIPNSFVIGRRRH